MKNICRAANSRTAPTNRFVGPANSGAAPTNELRYINQSSWAGRNFSKSERYSPPRRRQAAASVPYLRRLCALPLPPPCPTSIMSYLPRSTSNPRSVSCPARRHSPRRLGFPPPFPLPRQLGFPLLVLVLPPPDGPGARALSLRRRPRCRCALASLLPPRWL